jgi:N-acetylated-alpha-linked acidic dipeptidase
MRWGSKNAGRGRVTVGPACGRRAAGHGRVGIAAVLAVIGIGGGGTPLAAQTAPAETPAAGPAARPAAPPPAVRAAAQPLVGYTAAGAATERALEAQVIARPEPAAADTMSRALSREPHMAGTPAQARTRDYVLGLMRKWGLATEVRSYDVYMPQPTSIRVWRLGTAAAADSEELPLVEGPVAGDTTSSAFPQVPTFNAYSGTGNVAGDLVYANYGLIADYAHLDSVGVSVAGKVVIARYGKSFRGIKAREAERHGAAALLIYSDPGDDGYTRGDVYPEGPMRPTQGVQRGSIMNANGDPSTPGYPSTAGARRVDPAEMTVPRIPVVPISYGNATRLLQDLRGDGQAPAGSAGSVARSSAHLPQAWQGGLPFRYHVGPGPIRARVSFAADTGKAGYHTIWDTFAVIRGTEFPEEMVIVGGHRDAWGPGAADNVSGVVSVLETAHALADEVRAGHRPKRTIVLATWDAEEWGLIGSTEYVEDDSLRLLRGAVAYFNQDVSADGPTFGVTGSPSLRELARDVTRIVPDPDAGAGQSIYDAWRVAAPPIAPVMGPAVGARTDTAGPEFGDPGGGSDFAGFANHLGVPILAWGFGGLGGVYHSAYDDYNWESQFGDPGYRRHAASARVGAALVLRVANADVLPYDYVEYARTMHQYLPSIDKSIAARGWTASTAALGTAIDAMEHAAVEWAAVRDSVLGGTPVGSLGHPASAKNPARSTAPTAAALRGANAALLRVERALTRPAGLRTRPWYRSLIYASDEDNGYSDVVFPSVTEAVRSGDAALTAREIADLAARFGDASAALRDAAVAVRAPVHHE